MRHNVDMLSSPRSSCSPDWSSQNATLSSLTRRKCTRHARMKTSCPHLGPIHPSAPFDLCPPPPHLYSRNALRDPNVTAFFRFTATWLSSPSWAFGSSSESCVEEALPKR
ncbi:unnamed protein product [Musa acuminata subsp. malaccensis]|uniref:(wild Malaysian banana) hypothetical protein n=1 Tax=Musa acuminata subsp. malaccensis TaxID=214687 RepID=A0A804IAA4_MUSAM|nr:unnamed protein product [Musa acuminata subsp. malaccensis]